MPNTEQTPVEHTTQQALVHKSDGALHGICPGCTARSAVVRYSEVAGQSFAGLSIDEIVERYDAYPVYADQASALEDVAQDAVVSTLQAWKVEPLYGVEVMRNAVDVFDILFDFGSGLRLWRSGVVGTMLEIEDAIYSAQENPSDALHGLDPTETMMFIYHLGDEIESFPLSVYWHVYNENLPKYYDELYVWPLYERELR